MEQFTIKLGKRNDGGSLKSKIMNKSANTYPFMKWNGIHTKEDPAVSVQYAGPGDHLTFGINPSAHFAAINRKYYRPTACFISPTDCRYLKVPSYNADTELDLAMARLERYAKSIKDYEEDRGYDYTYMGLPVSIHQNFIQIGTNIIPLKNYRPILKTYSPEIINVIINISNTTEITNIYE